MKLYFRKTYFPFFLALTLAFAPCFKLLAQEAEIKKDTVILNYPAKIIPISDDELDEELDLDEDEIIISEQDSIPNDSTIVIASDSITVAGDSLTIIAKDSIVNIPEKPAYVIPIDFVPDMELVKKITSLPVYPLITYPDTVIFNSLAMPFIYWEDRISTVVPLPKSPLNDDFSLYKQFFKDKLFEDRNHKYDIQRNAYFYILDNHLVNYQYTKSQFKGKIEEEKQLETTIFDNLFKIEIDLEKDKAKPEKFQQKRKYWIKHGTHFIQFSQSSQSQNWGQGGLGNLALNSKQTFSSNYNKNKVTFNNYLEWSLVLANNPNDTLRSIRIDRDYLKYIGSFNLLAFKKWSYTTTLDAESRVLNLYQQNTDIVTHAFLAPLTVNMGILGMSYNHRKDYPKVKGKYLTFSTTISPLSVNYKLVANDKVDPAKHIKDGETSSLDIGSRATATLIVQFNQGVLLKSIFTYFTNFEYAHIELQNSLDMPINRFFNFHFFIFPTFDDSNPAAKHPKYGYVVTNQNMSVGFTYNW